MSSEAGEIAGRLREAAVRLRKILLPSKPIPHKPNLHPKSNVAVAEVHTNCGSFCLVATSNNKSPIPQPMPKSEGGQFEPQLDPYSGRTMDTDAEYKILSEIAVVLEMQYNQEIRGILYLYTELSPV